MRVLVQALDEGAERRLRKAADHGRDARPAFVRMLGDLEHSESNWFATGGGGTWPANDPDWRRRKQGKPPLELTGTLARSLQERHAPHAVREADRDRALFGTSDPVARIVDRHRPVLPPHLGRGLANRLRQHILDLPT